MDKELTKKFAPGHSTCAGCGIPAIARAVLGEIEDNVVVSNATGCLEVTSTVYPYSAWKVPYIHSAFENASATISGVEAAYKVLKKKGKLAENVKFVVFGGDGGTYDIGLQSLSGAFERGHDFLYVCYDNQGYMNTGGQRSGASPFGANTQTTPSAGNDIGNECERKDLMEIIKGHGIKYLAQANVAYLSDLKSKVRKALKIGGPSFILVLQPCTNEWKFNPAMYVRYGQLATETNFWPLYEIENGKYKINYKNKEVKPLVEFLKGQGRFRHLFEVGNERFLEEMQKKTDARWERLKMSAEMRGAEEVF